MTNKLQLIKAENVNNVFKEIQDAYLDIPFENSIFQTANFVVKGSVTPERAYRNIGLRMNNRMEALKEANFNIKKNDIEIERKQRKIDLMKKEIEDSKKTTIFKDKIDVSNYDLDIELLEMEIAKDLDSRTYTNKLAKDAITELSYLYGLFKQLPRFTRQEFEEAEQKYFTETLSNQVLGITGAADSINNMLKSGNPIDALNNYSSRLENKNINLLMGKLQSNIIEEEVKKIVAADDQLFIDNINNIFKEESAI